MRDQKAEIETAFAMVYSKISEPIPQTQSVALVTDLGGDIEFRDDYPVPVPGQNEVLAKVLYTGVCHSGEQSIHVVCSE